MERRTRFHVVYVVFAIVAMLLIQEGWQRAQTVEVLPYSDFEKLLAEGKIAEVVVDDTHITGKLKSPQGGKTVAIANRVEPQLADQLNKYDVKYTRVHQSTFLRDLLSWVVPALVFFAVWYFLARRVSQGGLGGGFMSIGKSRAKIYVESKTGVTFADVAGVDEAKTELQEVVEFLKDPKKYGRLGARVPKACCWSDRRAPARRCWRARSPERPGWRSSRSPGRSSWRCSSESALPGCATFSSRRAPRRRRSSSSTSSTRSGARGARSPLAAATTRRSRR